MPCMPSMAESGFRYDDTEPMTEWRTIMPMANWKDIKNWKEIYNSRKTTAAEAVQAIESGNRVYLTGNASVPMQLLDALVKRAPEVRDVEICNVLTICPPDYVAPKLQGHLRVNSMFISQNIRQAVNEGRADFTPVLLSEFPLLFKNGV